MAEYKIENSQIVFFGIKRNLGGKLNIAGQTELYNVQTGVTLGKTSTGPDGYWEFRFPVDTIISGRYEIRFYGSGTIQDYQPEGDWEVLDVIGSDNAALVLSGVPTLGVIEGNSIVDVNNGEQAVVNFNFTNLLVSNGLLKNIEVLYKLATYEEWKLIGNYPVDLAGTSLTLSVRFFLEKKNAAHQFQLKLKNGIGATGAYLDDTEAVITVTGVVLNGVADLSELYEVADLKVLNATDEESGQILSLFANLQWEDIRRIDEGFFPQSRKNGYDGSTLNITYAQAQKILGYDVFMFVSDTNTPPSTNYPGSDPNWYYIGEFLAADAKVRCPGSKYVAFWVGMKMENTASLVVKRNLQY